MLLYDHHTKDMTGHTGRNPSRSALSQTPRKLLLADFGLKRAHFQSSWGRSGGFVTLSADLLGILASRSVKQEALGINRQLHSALAEKKRMLEQAKDDP